MYHNNSLGSAIDQKHSAMPSEMDLNFKYLQLSCHKDHLYMSHKIPSK